MKRGKSYVHNKHTQISPKELQREIYIYIYISNSTKKVARKIYKAMLFKGSKDPRPLKQRS